ncbi:MAG TPA: hypothetical protein VLG50_03810 [Candidatus Saccharimonadales bacterium]|nr:hypothetical protein [Candidatus Saccharimonadales bacterium]
MQNAGNAIYEFMSWGNEDDPTIRKYSDANIAISGVLTVYHTIFAVSNRNEAPIVAIFGYVLSKYVKNFLGETKDHLVAREFARRDRRITELENDVQLKRQESTQRHATILGLETRLATQDEAARRAQQLLRDRDKEVVELRQRDVANNELRNVHEKLITELRSRLSYAQVNQPRDNRLAHAAQAAQSATDETRDNQ